jgi:hypothetical protein
MLTFLPILLFLGKVANANSCKFKTNRGTFDLSPLAGKSFSVPAYGNNFYYFSICGNTADVSNCGGSISDVCAVQYQAGTATPTCYDLGTWDNSYKLTSSTDGFSLEFHNGSDKLCNFARSIKFIFKCSEGTPSGTLIPEEPADCIYEVTVPTMYVCDEYAIHVTDELSSGSIFLIVLLVLITVYCIGGFGYNSYKGSARGIQAAPQASFWCTQLPFWVKTGCMVSWAFTVRVFNNIRAKVTGVPQVNRGTTDTGADGTYENLD